MRFKSAIGVGILTLGSLALTPAWVLAAEPLAQPQFIDIDGKAVPMQVATHMIRTAAGTATVQSWHWESPNGSEKVFIQTSSAGMPSGTAAAMRSGMAARQAAPEWALRQMQLMQSQVDAMQAQMAQLDQTAVSTMPSLPAPMVTTLQRGVAPSRIVLIPTGMIVQVPPQRGFASRSTPDSPSSTIAGTAPTARPKPYALSPGLKSTAERVRAAAPAVAIPAADKSAQTAVPRVKI